MYKHLRYIFLSIVLAISFSFSSCNRNDSGLVITFHDNEEILLRPVSIPIITSNPNNAGAIYLTLRSDKPSYAATFAFSCAPFEPVEGTNINIKPNDIALIGGYNEIFQVLKGGSITIEHVEKPRHEMPILTLRFKDLALADKSSDEVITLSGDVTCRYYNELH